MPTVFGLLTAVSGLQGAVKINDKELVRLKKSYTDQKRDWLGNTNVRVGSDGVNYLGALSKDVSERARKHWMPCTLEELVVQKVMVSRLRAPAERIFFYNSQYRAAQEVANALKNQKIYYMRTDVQQCVAFMRFATIERIAKKWELSQKGYLDALDVLKHTAFHLANGDSQGFHRAMPLTTLFQEMLLTEIDFFFKATYPSLTYVRYVDDILVFGEKPFDWEAVHQTIASFAEQSLGLSLHPVGSEKTTYFKIDEQPPHNFVKLNWFDVSADQIRIRAKIISWLEEQVRKIIRATVRENDLELCVKDIGVLLLGLKRQLNPKSFANAFIHSGNYAQARSFDKRIRRLVHYHFSPGNKTTIKRQLKQIPSMRKLLA